MVTWASTGTNKKNQINHLSPSLFIFTIIFCIRGKPAARKNKANHMLQVFQLFDFLEFTQESKLYRRLSENTPKRCRRGNLAPTLTIINKPRIIPNAL
jgi:hypothetical protein